MELEYTEEQLNNFDKKTLVQLFLVQQSQLKEIDTKLQLLLEQVAVLNQKRFGRSSEKLEADNNQMAFIEVDGKIVFFNEAEAVAAITEYDEDEPIKPRPKKAKGKRASLIQDLPVVPVHHMMTDEELIAEFGDTECKVCECSSILPSGAGVCQICCRDYKKRDGTLDDSLYRTVSFSFI